MKLLLIGVFLFLPAWAFAAAKKEPFAPTSYSEEKCSNTREQAHTTRNWDKWIAYLQNDGQPAKKKKKRRRGKSTGRR